ncbi:MAG: PEP-CTERM sorting domain-containing protein [Phycisphaerae bacterium]
MFSKVSPMYRGGRISSFIAGAAMACMALTAAHAQASTITGVFSSPPASANSDVTTNYTPINIATDAAAWVYYGYTDQSSYTGGSTAGGMMNTDASNVASFSPLNYNANSTQSGGGLSGATGWMQLTYPGASPTSSTAFIFDQAPSGGSSTNNFYFTTNLIAPAETLNLYLISYDSKSNITATLPDGGTFTADSVVLPYSPASDTDGTGKGHGYGILSLNITGGTVGQTLTFTDTNNITGVSNDSYSNVGIQAANVVVPEPATLGLVAVGGLGLLLLKRRKTV